MTETAEITREAGPPPSPAVSDAAMRTALGHWFGLERERVTCTVLIAMYRHIGEGLTANQLAVIASSTPHAIVKHHVPALRQALNTEAVDFAPTAGYRLTEIGMSECRAALWTMGEELRRAG